MAALLLAKLHSLADYLSLPTDATSFSVFLVTALVASFALYSFSERKRRRAPGPWGLPFVGYLPFMGKPAHVEFQKLAKKYGPVMSIHLGSMDCTVLGSSEAVKEAFVKQNDNFSGRPSYLTFKVYDHESSFIYKEGEMWKDLRTFSIQTLRELGFGQQNLEPVVQSEVQYFIKYLEEESTKQSEGLSIGRMLEKSIGNTICGFLIGYRCEYDDPWLNHVVEVVEALQNSYVADFAFFFPWMWKVPVLNTFLGYSHRRDLRDEMYSLWRQKISEAKTVGTMNGVNFLSSWLNEYKKRVDSNDPAADRFNDASLLSNVDILCEASFETSSTTLQWAFLFMLEHPELQKKLQDEIDEVIGQERLPAYSDAKNLPFTRAFIAETHRKGSIVPLGVFHVNRESTFLMGHWIPKRTLVIPNLFAVHHDPKIFPDPDRFDPSRFLDAEGNFVRHESVIPFSVGKRFCPGEFVAEMQVFLYLTMLLQKYTILSSSGHSIQPEPNDTIINHPKPFNVLVKPR